MIQFEAIQSGSSGNSILVRDDETCVLVDAGISCRRIATELCALGIDPKSLKGIFITHEHIDHVAGLPLFAVKYGIPVYASEGTFQKFERSGKDPDGLLKPLFRAVQAGERIPCGTFSVKPFRTYHDAREPLAYRFESGGISFAVFTDSGSFTENTVEMLSDLDGALLESNHDRSMLANGPYPMRLKRRIMSSEGHMSNNAAGQLLGEIISPKLKTVLLGHLSQENNTHEIALKTVREELASVYGEAAAARLELYVAPQDGISHSVEL